LSQTSRINDQATGQANLLIPLDLISDQALRTSALKPNMIVYSNSVD